MGASLEPATLHKYLYGNVDPVNNVDPSGNFSIGQIAVGFSMAATLRHPPQSIIQVS